MLGWIILTLSFSFLLGLLLGGLADGAKQSMGVRFLFVLQPLVADNSYRVAAAILSCVVVTIVVFISIGLVANFRYRRKVMSRYEFEPKKFAAKDKPGISGS
jgi:uncharacterized membrane protein YjgN (DUF898 family)